MKTLILPCAGLSTRYPNMRPKYLLTCPSGDLVLKKALDSVVLDDIARIVVVLLSEHESEYHVINALRKSLPATVEYLVLDAPTRGPADTVYRAITEMNISSQVIVKDSDSFFDPISSNEGSFVGVLDLRENLDIKKIAAKSFSIINEHDIITSIVEKNVVSNFISGGVYGFSSAELFKTCFQSFESHHSSEIFVSHIIDLAISEGEIFSPQRLTGLVDVGTIDDWGHYTQSQSVYFVDIDGLIFRNQSYYFAPYWGDEVCPLQRNIECLLDKERAGAQLVFTTSRPEEFRRVTLEALARYGFASKTIVMGLNHGPRYLINDYSPRSNPYPTARAVNIERNCDNLEAFLK